MYESADIPTAEITERYVDLPEIRLHLAETGRGPPVILLHGFPEFWYSWRNQLPVLAAAGFRAIAPDLRGYNASDKPPAVKSYAIEALVADVVALIQREADGRALLVGHDWGGVIAWRVAALRPDLVSRLAVLNAPHPAAFRRELWRNPVQWFKSAYVPFFLIPGLAEWFIRRRNFIALETAFRRIFSPAELGRMKKALSRPGGLTAPLNYYRAGVRFGRGFSTPPQEVTVPTLLIWGERDPYLGVGLTRGLERWVPDLRIERIPDAGHFVQTEAAERVNSLLLKFFAR